MELGLPVGEHDVDSAQQVFGVVLPVDYRDFLLGENGREWWSDSGDVARLDPLREVLGLWATTGSDGGLRTTHPGLLAVGGDGSREVLAYDTRRERPPLVLVDVTSSGWHDAFYQAGSLTEFLRTFRARGWDFETVYDGA